MRDLAILICVVSAVLGVWAAPLRAQAWVQAAGGYYTKLTASYLSSSEQYNFKGELEPIATGTRFTWREQLDLPWFFGGRFGAIVAEPVLAWVWRRNLARLASRFD